jgi:hypothetical protein
MHQRQHMLTQLLPAAHLQAEVGELCEAAEAVRGLPQVDAGAALLALAHRNALQRQVAQLQAHGGSSSVRVDTLCQAPAGRTPAS